MKTLMKTWLRSSREGRSLRENELFEKIVVFRKNNAIKGKSLANSGFFFPNATKKKLATG